MKASTVLCKAGKSASSSRWLTRQLSDPFVRQRTSPTSPSSSPTIYRSRASHKILSLSLKYPKLLPRNGVVVDLGCAPGGWAQVASKKVGRGGRVVGVDLLEVRELGGGYENVRLLKGDFLARETQERLRSALLEGRGGGDVEVKVNTVLSDMMANMTGVRVRDVENSLELCSMALMFARKYLKIDKTGAAYGNGLDEEEVVLPEEKNASVETGKSKGKGREYYPGGNLLLKHFAHPDFSLFRKTELEPVFHKVHYVKPEASRSESSEGYFVCLGYKGG